MVQTTCSFAIDDIDDDDDITRYNLDNVNRKSIVIKHHKLLS